MYLFTVVLVMGAGNVINDYFDREIDLINRPGKVIVGQVLSMKLTLGIYLGLNILAILLCASWLIMCYVLSAMFMLLLYSYKLKKLPLVGNLVVSLLTFLSIYLVSFFFDVDYPVLIFAFLGACIQFLREIIKDLEDIRGDKEGGCRTFPVLFGVPNTKLLIYMFAGIFICSMLYWQWTLQKHVWSLYAVYYLLTVFVVKVFRASHKSHFTVLSSLLKMTMVVGLLTVLFV